MNYQYTSIFTPFSDSFYLLWTIIKDKPKIIRLYLNKKAFLSDIHKKDKMLKEDSCREIEKIKKDIKSSLEGHKVYFDINILFWNKVTDFQKKVLLYTKTISLGQIKTYSEIAISIAYPTAIRAVGNALATNPFPILIPCHRVIKKDLSLGKYQGGILLKKKLLRLEGIQFDKKDKIKL